MKNGNLLLFGAQYGDEGKGKLSEILAERFDYAVRYQGGDNAGHTVQIGGARIALRLLPAAILHENKTAAIGNGCAVNVRTLLGELEALRRLKIKPGRLLVSDRAHVVLGYHAAADDAAESRKGAGLIGTTRRGIGPCYADKAARIGIRVCDLSDYAALKAKIGVALRAKTFSFRGSKRPAFDAEALAREHFALGKRIKKHVADLQSVLADACARNETILFEGAQGGMLDLDFGTYPYVTSSNPLAGAYSGSGVGLGRIGRTLAAVKAYVSRVGSGPLPTELFGDVAERIRIAGNEYGTVTKRPRRIGWIDLVALRHVLGLAGCDAIAITLVDALTGLGEIKACVAYRLGNETIVRVPASAADYARCVPVYETFRG